jgi:hypothetical protein
MIIVIPFCAGFFSIFQMFAFKLLSSFGGAETFSFSVYERIERLNYTLI